MPLPKSTLKRIADNPDAAELALRYECALQIYGSAAWGDGKEIPRTTKGYMPKAERVTGCTCEQFWSRRPAKHQTDNRHLRIKYKIHFEVLRAIAWLAQRHRRGDNWNLPPVEVLVNVALDLHMAANLGVWKSAWDKDGTHGAETIYQIYNKRMEEYCERTGTTSTNAVPSGVLSVV